MHKPNHPSTGWVHASCCCCPGPFSELLGPFAARKADLVLASGYQVKELGKIPESGCGSFGSNYLENFGVPAMSMKSNIAAADKKEVVIPREINAFRIRQCGPRRRVRWPPSRSYERPLAAPPSRRRAFGEGPFTYLPFGFADRDGRVIADSHQATPRNSATR